MSRPSKNNLDYFSHDNCMRNDKKMKAVRSRFGITGYAVYCMLLESIAEESCLQLKNTDFSIDVLAGDFGISSEDLKKMIEYFTIPELNLIQIDSGYIRCKQLEKRSKYVFDKRGKSIEMARNEVSVAKTIVSDTETHVSVELMPQSKVKKSIVKKNKENIKRKKFVPPTLTEVENYCSERMNTINPEQFIDFYESKNWMIGKNKMKDWKAAVRTWERTDTYRNQRYMTPAEKTMATLRRMEKEGKL